MRRKLPQINQNFKGSTFKDGDVKNATHHSSSRQHMGNTNNDTMMGSTSFLDSSCTLPVSRNINWDKIYDAVFSSIKRKESNMSKKRKYIVIRYVKVPRNNHQITFTIYTSFKQTTTFIRSHVKITFIQPISTFHVNYWISHDTCVQEIKICISFKCFDMIWLIPSLFSD